MRKLLTSIAIFLGLLFVPISSYAQATPTPTVTPTFCQDGVILPTITSVKLNNFNTYQNVWTANEFINEVARIANCPLTQSQKDTITAQYNTDHAPTTTPGAVPTAVPQNSPLCGTLNNTCCTDFSNIGLDSKLGQQNDFLCVDLFLIHWCLSSIVNGISTMVGDSIGLDSLQRLGTCKQYQVDQNGKQLVDSTNTPLPLRDQGVQYSLVPQHDDVGTCTCRRSDGISSIKTEYCASYIASSLIMKKGGDLQVGVPAKVGPQLKVGDLTKDPEYNHCIDCFALGGHWSGLGCIYSTNWPVFIQQNVLGLAISFGGIAAFLCILYAAFVLQTSAGNPERVKNAQQLLTSCIMGLMLIIFSLFILRLIGVTILHIPGFQ